MARNSFTLAVSFLFLNCFSLCCLSTDVDKYALLAIKSNIIDRSDILSNNWSVTSNASICSWIGVTCDFKNQRVTALNLSSMDLAGTVSPAIGNLSFLTSLDTSYNNFSGSLPKELSHLKDLQYLLLFNNSFTGTIPASLGNITKLEVLELRFNQLTGTIPAVIFNISSLRVINLSTNDFYGSLPVDMCSYHPKLEGIYLSYNRFEGRIPLSMYKCRELQYLSLSVNEFSGSIPKEIGNLTRLKYLFLSYNNLGGEIPNSIFNMSSLKVINLGVNNLSASIPMDIHNDVPVLEELYLYRNQLTGQIPSRLWDYRGLQFISLFENKFTGSISNNVGNLTLLKVLDLNGNNFTVSLGRGCFNRCRFFPCPISLQWRFTPILRWIEPYIVCFLSLNFLRLYLLRFILFSSATPSIPTKSNIGILIGRQICSKSAVQPESFAPISSGNCTLDYYLRVYLYQSSLRMATLKELNTVMGKNLKVQIHRFN